jgi:hypothetical protein
MTRYVWPNVTLECDRSAGRVSITYSDGYTCSVDGAGPDDHTFGRDLGCSGEDHITLHEILHQLLGHRYYGSEWGSPVVRRAATGEPQPAEGHSEPEEKMCWALTRMVFGKHLTDPWFEPEWIERLTDAGVEVHDLVYDARWLFQAPDGVTVHLPA